jgi:transcriptional regulator with XRE-family HTH domain
MTARKMASVNRSRVNPGCLGGPVVHSGPKAPGREVGGDMSTLRDARADRGWSQTRLAAEVLARASASGSMTRTSLKTAISRWENGHVQPDAYNRGLLRGIFGLTDEELGFDVRRRVTALVASEPLAALLTRARSVDGEMIDLLVRQTDALRRLDRRVGAPALLAQMSAHGSTLADLTSHATKAGVRQQLAAALADASALSAWQALDVGATQRAWSGFERAKAAAREANDLELFAYAQAEQAYILLDLGEVDDAAEAAAAARDRAARKAAPRAVAWLNAAAAEMSAAAGDHRGAQEHLAAAWSVIP